MTDEGAQGQAALLKKKGVHWGLKSHVQMDDCS
jgi:hypothetical protein